MSKILDGTTGVKRLWIFGVGLLLILAVITVGLFVWQGSTKEIEAAADKFDPGEGWTLVSESVESPRIVCLSGASCPSVDRSWDATSSEEGFEHILQKYKALGAEDFSRCSWEDLNKEFICSFSLDKQGYMSQFYVDNQDEQLRLSIFTKTS